MLNNTTMHAKDAISGSLASCYMTISGNRYNFMQLTEFESKYKPKIVEVPILGRTNKGHKTVGGAGTWSAKAHYNQSIMREIMYKYQTTGIMEYFDIQVTNEDPTSAVGRQTVIHRDCLLESNDMDEYVTVSLADGTQETLTRGLWLEYFSLLRESNSYEAQALKSKYGTFYSDWESSLRINVVYYHDIDDDWWSLDKIREQRGYTFEVLERLDEKKITIEFFGELFKDDDLVIIFGPIDERFTRPNSGDIEAKKYIGVKKIVAGSEPRPDNITIKKTGETIYFYIPDLTAAGI